MSYYGNMNADEGAAPGAEPQTWYTVQQVADRLQVNPVTVLRWIRQGQMPYLDLGGRKAGYRVRADVLEEWERQRYGYARDHAESP